MARGSNSMERRAQITDALIQVMAAKGYAGASVAQVARKAKLTPGLVHYHFANKHEILLAAVATITEQHRAALEAQLAHANDDPIAAIELFVDFHLAMGAAANADALACWIMLSGEALRDEKVRGAMGSALARIAERLAGLIELGIERMLFACPDTRAAAGALIASMQGFFVTAGCAREVIVAGSAASCARQMAAGLLRPVRAFEPSPLAAAGERR